MKTYTPKSAAEGEGLHKGTITEIVIPIADLPTYYVQGRKPEQYGPAAFAFLDMADPIGTYPTCKVSPYAPGDRIRVKERCAPCFCKSIVCTGYIYPNELGWKTRVAGNPYLAESMPLKAVRTRLFCEAVAVRQIDGQWYFVVQVKRKGE